MTRYETQSDYRKISCGLQTLRRMASGPTCSGISSSTISTPHGPSESNYCEALSVFILMIYGSIANNGTQFYFQTDKDAPRLRLISVDLAHPSEQRVIKDIIPEDKSASQDHVTAIGDHFVVQYLRNVGPRPKIVYPITDMFASRSRMRYISTTFLASASHASRRTSWVLRRSLGSGPSHGFSS